MEILFNLVWLVLSAGLAGIWLAGWRSRNETSQMSTVRTQLVALAILIVILLPVVSLTDDLQACAAPAEAEHLLRRGDPLTAHDLFAHTIHFALAEFDACQAASEPPCVAFSAFEHRARRPETGHLTVTAIRPPPASASL